MIVNGRRGEKYKGNIRKKATNAEKRLRRVGLVIALSAAFALGSILRKKWAYKLLLYLWW